MASGLSFFFSSPPHPTPNSWQRATSNYYTPQQASRTTWSPAFAPPSPSPLRTSRNANLMSSPAQGGDLFPKHTEQDSHNENTFIATSTALPAPLTTTSTSTPSTLFPTTSDLSTTFPAPTPSTSSFSFSAAPSSTFTLAPTQPKPIFQFSSHARASAPTTQLQTHTREARESRKRLFLDRLRTRRDDSRSERLTDQVLRMEFMRERRMWELEMEGEEVRVRDPDEMSDELEEVEELVEEYFEMGWDEEFDFEDDAYEEAFREVLSQEGPVGGWDGAVDGVQQGAVFGNVHGGQQEQKQQHDQVPGFELADSEMDMS